MFGDPARLEPQHLPPLPRHLFWCAC
jgi:hypothetical protein